MKYQEQYRYDYGAADQAMAERQGWGILTAFRWVREVYIYLPLLTIGYWVASLFLKSSDSAFAWIGTILAIAIILFGMVMAMKEHMQELRYQRKPAWILWLLVLVSLTCVMTPVILHPWIAEHFARWHWPNELAWTTDIAIGAYIFYRYRFLG